MENNNKAVIRATRHDKREVAKTAMTVSLGAVIATGLMKGGGAKVLHMWSGIALMGFSYWHYKLYQPDPRKRH